MTPEAPLIVCWFSCGAASAVAAKKAIEKFGAGNVHVVCCDTRASEHPDNYRFSSEVERWLGQPIQNIRNVKFETVDDVFAKTKYMAGIGGARCTTELKKKPRFAFAKPDDIHVFGFTADETKRIKEFESRNPELSLSWVLRDAGISKEDCYKIIESAGIRLPAMYELGFDNNNCPGCVKATSPWYWDLVRHHFPDVFLRRCEQSRGLNVKLVELGGNRIFLDLLPYGPFKKHKRRENLSCGPECGVAVPADMEDPLF